MQTAFFYRKTLITIRVLSADGVEHGAEASLGNQLPDIDVVAGVGIHGDHGGKAIRFRLSCGWRQYGSSAAGVVVLNELPDLLFERHLVEQAIDTGLERGIGKLSV